MPTVARILELAPTCSRLAEDHRFKRAMFKGTPKSSQNQGTLIYIYWKILNYFYERDNDYDGLRAPADYLWELCQKWAFKAANIVDGGGGGTVAPVTPSAGSLPNPLDFIVDATSTPMLAGASSVVLSQFIGYDVEFYRGGQPQYTTNPGDGTSYYSWNRVNGTFFISPAANLGEPFRIVPIGGFASTSTTIVEQRQPVFAIVGLTAGAPTAGASTWQNSNFANAYVVLFKNGTPVPSSNPGTGDAYITKALTSDTITISNYAWTAGDQLFVMITVP